MSQSDSGSISLPERIVASGAAELLTKATDLLAGQEAYVVGGFIRGLLMGRDTADIDVAVAGNGLETASNVAKALGGHYVLLDETNGVGRVILTGMPSVKGPWQLDFSTLVAGSIRRDLERRDFTVNAMAFDLDKIRTDYSNVHLIDPVGGLEDLRARTIRAVTGTVFMSDPVRLLRAVRLAAELGFHIEGKTEGLVRRDAQLLAHIAGERVREELLRILAVPGVGAFLSYMDNLGLLRVLIPELAPAEGVEQPVVHYWDVFEHSLKTVTAVEYLLHEGKWEYGNGRIIAAVPWSETLAKTFDQEVSHGSTRRSLLKLASLLHDIGKPQTKTIEETGRVRFLGHPEEGADTVSAILERLRFSAKEIKFVGTLVKYHMRPTQMSQDGLPTRRAIYRYFRDTGDDGIDILFLSLADHLATRGPGLDLSEWQRHNQVVEFVLTERLKESETVRPPKLVTGHDLMNTFGLSPGPEVGRILEAVREAQASGEIKTREEGLALVREMLTTKPDRRVDGANSGSDVIRE